MYDENKSTGISLKTQSHAKNVQVIGKIFFELSELWPWYELMNVCFPLGRFARQLEEKYMQTLQLVSVI